MKTRLLKIRISVLAAILLCCICLPVQADLITIGLTGKIIRADDPQNVFGGQIQWGDTVTGTYTYDTSTPDSEPLDPSAGVYWHYNTPCGVSVTINNFIFQTNPNNIRFKVGIGDNYPSFGDIYNFISYNNSPLPNGTSIDTIVWQITDSTGTALSSDALPTTAPNLDDWNMDYGLSITGPRGWDYLLRADITSVMLIPEPTTLLLLAFGIIVCKLRKS
ncbi:MAG: PEP-CTERM sorting domain-containing protein [Sedimentisphaerales bacterium]